jgi:anti-anti-sigma regulatory factor
MAQSKKSPRRARAHDKAGIAPQTPLAQPIDAPPTIAPPTIAPPTIAPPTIAPPTIAPLTVALPTAGMASINVLQLGSSLSIREVGECALQLKTMLSSGATDIDASKLESIDTAGIQLLLAAATTAQRRGFKLKLLGAQGLKTGAARSLGLQEHLGELAEILP